MNLFLYRLYFLFLFSTILISSLFSQTRWTQQNSGTSNILTYVDFINKDTGLVVGASGTLLSTTDGGKAWVKINLGLTDDLSTVTYVDKDVVFISGSNGLVLKSINGGLNWTKQNSGVSSILYTVNFVDKNTGYAAGLNGVIIKTIDGGSTWFRQNSPTSNHLYRVQFLNKDVGVIAANDGIVLRTFNGGNTWSILNTPVSQRLHYINFIDLQRGFASGDGGTLLSTTDFGNTWARINTQANGILNCVKILDSRYAYIVGESGLILKTIDGGIIWKNDNSGITTRLVSVCFPEIHTGYAVGANGRILKTLPDSIAVMYCAADTSATLIAPEGYQSYTWINSTSNVIGTGRIISVKNNEASRAFSCRVVLGDSSEILLYTTLRNFQLDADFDSEIINCQLNSVKFTNKSLFSDSPIKYKWDFGDGAVSTEKNPVHSYNGPGKRTVVLEISSPLSSCPDTISKEIEVFSPTNVEIQGDTLCCKGYTLTMRAVGAPAYLWSDGSTADTLVVNENSGRIWVIGLFGAGICQSDTVFKTIRSARFPVSVSGHQTYCPDLTTKISAHGAKNYFWSTGISADTIEISAPGGDYWVYGQSAGGCYSDTLHFSVSEEPDWDFSISGQLSFCKNDSTQISVNGSVSNVWISAETESAIFISKPGDYSVVGLNSRGCEKHINFTVSENESPNSVFSVSTNQVDRKNNTLAVTVNPELDTDYFWEMGDGSFVNGASHQHVYNVRNNMLEFIVRLTATNKYGCVSYTEQSIDVVPFIPNVFTPNGDGINDVFVPDIDVLIIDRLGKSLYRGTEGWDGTFGGKQVPNDTYFYFVYYADKYGVVQTKKGTVTLIR